MTSKKQKKNSPNSSEESTTNNFIQVGPVVQYGWQCPVCQCVFAPWVSKCENCGPQWTVTYPNPDTTDGSWPSEYKVKC
jgi:hypothetical protein